MYNHTLHHRRKRFWCYFLRAFSREEILKSKIKDYFKINGKQRIRMPKKGEYVKFRNYERKIKLPVMIYATFESILSPEDNENQNQEESYTSKYQKHIASSYDCKLVCVYYKFSKPFQTYLGKDVV